MGLVANWKRMLGIAVGVLVVVFVLIQVIPVDKTNPAVAAEPAWDSPQTHALAKDACFDCHSNETVWPWYSKIAPVSWLTAHDVDEGRSKLNFSEWGSGENESGEIADVINSGEMPPFYYAMMHRNARLSDSEKQQLIDGLRASMGQSVTSEGEQETSNDDAHDD